MAGIRPCKSARNEKLKVKAGIRKQHRLVKRVKPVSLPLEYKALSSDQSSITAWAMARNLWPIFARIVTLYGVDSWISSYHCAYRP